MFRILYYTHSLDIENLGSIWCMSITHLISIRKGLFSEFLLFDTKTNTNEDFMSIFPAFYDDLKEHIITYKNHEAWSQMMDHQAHDLYGHSLRRLLPQLLP